MSKKILVVFLIILLMFSIVVTGCSSGQSDGDENAPSEESLSEDQLKTLTITASFPLFSDPAIASSAVESVVMQNLYDSFIFAELDGSISPNVAKDWKISEDGLSYEFDIQEGIKFHDGSELNADDVVYSMNRMLEIGQGYSYLYEGYVKNIEKVDDYKVIVNMNKPYGPFIASLVRFYVLNEDLIKENYDQDSAEYGENKDYGKNWLLTNGAGSGPYKMTEMNMGESMIAQLNEDYWKELDPNVPKFFKCISWTEPSTVRTLMSRRELDIADEWQSIENVNALDQIEGVDVEYLHAGSMGSIELNTKKSPTDCIHFRKALAYLIDYETVITQIYPDSIQPVGPVASVYNGHDESLYQYTLDKEKALEELKQSIYYDDLENQVFTLGWSADVPDEEKIALMLQANAAELGINIEIYKEPYSNLVEQAASPEATHNGVIFYPADSYNEAGSVLNMRYHSNTTGTILQYEWLQNDEIDAAIEDSLSTINKEERFEKYSEIQEAIIELSPTIWVFENFERRAYQSYLTWEAAEYAERGELNCPIMGRFIYLPEIKIDTEMKTEMME